jgi:uncharacterized membrane protein
MPKQMTRPRERQMTGLLSGPVNVGASERQGSLAAGSILALLGLRSFAKAHLIRGGLFALVGASLISRGTTGHCALYDALGVDTSDAA